MMDKQKKKHIPTYTKPFAVSKRQDGMALISALYVLAAVALLAAGMASDTMTDFKIAGNRRIHQQVFYLADGGLNIGVQIVRDIVWNQDDGIVNPEMDYPHDESVALNADRTLYMENFSMDVNHIIEDLYGFEGNDNETDGTDPESIDPRPDIMFDLVQYDPESTIRTKIALDLDLLGKKPWGDIKFATGYDDPASNKWIYFFNVSSRATDMRDEHAAARPKAEVSTVYAVLK